MGYLSQQREEYPRYVNYLSNFEAPNTLFYAKQAYSPFILFLYNQISGACRDRKEWKYIKKEKESSFENVAAPTMNDFNLFGKSILDFIEMVMDFESNSKFPSLGGAKELLEDKEKMACFDLTVPALRKDIKFDDEIIDDVRESGGDLQGRQTLSCAFETNYDANTATVDVPLKHDLASDKTLDILLSYSETVADNCLKDEVSEEEDYSPITSEISPYLCGDGNPIWGIYKQLRKCEGTGKYKRRMPAYFGGFHLILETHKKRGSLFGETHLRDIFRKWRPSDKMLDWVMTPGDPGQVDEEMVMYHLGEKKKIKIPFVHPSHC